MAKRLQSPRVTVIIVNYNGLDCLKLCLTALKRQRFKDFKVIVVDNGSRDGSQAWVKRYQNEVLLLEMGYNSGFSKANNAGLSLVEGDYVALLNNDAIAHQDWLYNLVASLDAAPDRVGSAASKMVYYDRPDRIDRAGDGYSYVGAGLLRGRGAPASEFSRSEMVFGACAGAALYRRQMLEELKGFDEDYFLIYEDVDLSFRAQLKGYQCLYVANAVAFHMASYSIGYDSAISVYHGHHNIERVFLKNMPAKLLLASLVPHLLYVLLAGLFFALRGNGVVYWRAKWDVLKNLPRIVEKRHLIQNTTVVRDHYLWRQFSSPQYLARWRQRQNHCAPKA